MNKFFTRFKASEHGGEYLMRFISAWLCSLILILPLRSISKVFVLVFVVVVSVVFVAGSVVAGAVVAGAVVSVCVVACSVVVGSTYAST